MVALRLPHNLEAMEPEREKLIEVDDVAETIGMSRDWIYSEARADRIPHIRLGRYIRFRRASIEAWLRDKEQGK